ncbi:hypothetical protein RRG08_000005 [Elysia crispata]|uniref:Uncharacterized protein n=1 Tax=Elysia crispata TaxID=231223 RepID=A0AAE1CT02_9GAST|nr:hypothetical protein RRG08_000005 [Elysia crispata]
MPHFESDTSGSLICLTFLNETGTERVTWVRASRQFPSCPLFNVCDTQSEILSVSPSFLRHLHSLIFFEPSPQTIAVIVSFPVWTCSVPSGGDGQEIGTTVLAGSLNQKRPGGRKKSKKGKWKMGSVR